MGQARNWEAIGAVAGIAGVFLALVAWVAPNDSSPQAGPAQYPTQTTAPVYVTPPVYSPPPFTSHPTIYSPPTTSDVPTTSTTQQPTSAAPPAPVPSIRPLGCDDSFNAINTFDKAWAAATTPGARYIAADNGYKTTAGIVLTADDPPRSQDTVLESDFVGITGALMDDEPVEPQQLTRLNADIAALQTACGAT
jgi:hypothetical protein